MRTNADRNTDICTETKSNALKGRQTHRQTHKGRQTNIHICTQTEETDGAGIKYLFTVDLT